MFGFVHCNASLLARQATDPRLFLVRVLVKNWLWPIITFFGVTGNILAVIVLTKRRMIMSSTNNYLVALALVDIAYLILTLILNTSQHPCFIGTTLSDVLSTIFRPIADFFSNTSVWLTVTFTVERWVAITYPLQSRTWCTVNRARKIIMSVMCAALICTSPSAFEMKLVRVFELRNSTDPTEKPRLTSRLRARPTALGNSSLYHQIYFNFVTFAIIWIPLLMLAVFNTILIVSVRGTKHDECRNSGGVQLRRHNRGQQGEQRKTTIMLIAVVIVFTVCQIPQAISLTVQSFFPVLAQTPKVLIYNNFANCLVAINASTNFILYCCFSGRFRSTCRSSFAFLYKCCADYVEPKWKLTTDQSKYSISLENMSCTYPHAPSSYSLQGHLLHSRASNLSTDLSQKHQTKVTSTDSQRQSQLSSHHSSLWTSMLARFRSHRRDRTDFKWTLIRQNTETGATSSPASIMRSGSSMIHQSPVPSVFLAGYSLFRSSATDETRSLRSSAVSSTDKETDMKLDSPTANASNCSTRLNDSDSRIRKTTMNRPGQASTLRPVFPSSRSSNDRHSEHIWIKRRLSQGTINELFNRQQPFLWKEIVDVTV